MKNHVYKTLEMTGSSEKSIEHAVEGALQRTGQSVLPGRKADVGFTKIL